MNGPLGLEQGFTVAAPPDDEAGAIVLELAVGRGWHVRAAGGDAVALEEIGGPGRLRYAHLTAVDAAGAVLPASLTAAKERIAIRVESAGAQYPVTIDPVFQAQLAASDGAAGDFFGVSVAASGDTAVVGADLDDVSGRVDQGSAYVFARSGTTWSETAHLDSSDPGSSAGGAAGDKFGHSVALSNNGQIVAWIGSPEEDPGGRVNAGGMRTGGAGGPGLAPAMARPAICLARRSR